MIDTIVERYLALRDRKAQLKAEYERKASEIESALDKCEMYLLQTLNEQGVESMKTRVGTAYKQNRTFVSVADWESYFAWLRDNDMWSMLEHRANKTAVEEYRAVHNDVPPGLNWREETVVNVRRS